MPRRLQDGLGDHTPYNVPGGVGPKRPAASRPGIRASVSRRLRCRSNAQRKTAHRFVGIRRLRAGGEPAFALRPGGKQPVPFDDVMEALRTLDKEANAKDSAHYRRLLRRGRLGMT